MKLDATKILLALIALIGSLVSYQAVNIQKDVSFLKQRVYAFDVYMAAKARSGELDSKVDGLVAGDSLTEKQREFIDYVLENIR